MQITTRRFGPIEIDDNESLAVPSGIPGFPEMRHVALLGDDGAPSHPGDDGHTRCWLQDLDDGDLAFLCIVPWAAFPEYSIKIDERSLGIENDAEMTVLTLVTTRHEHGATHMTANLRAPLVVDTRNRRLHQVILSDSRLSIRAPFVPLASPPTAAGSEH